ncbi:MAG: phytanoyl-CoA dioxygenase family protein [Hyphomonadaceae bacterium JAD_PAG50586_4]|nr:MAG: phytanoyl-CoA dioxygenase family protein [Hyphomonadaceae bacterium JAD_PAG50586_4]
MARHATEDLLRQGYVIIPDAVSRAEIDLVAAEMAPHFEATPKCEGDFYGWETTRLGGLLTKAPRTRNLVLHPEVLGIVETVLSPSCDCIQLNLTQGVRIHPGERAQAPHRDEEMWPLKEKAKPWLVNVIWALSDFSFENGATLLWPGSHHDALDRSLDPSCAIAARMKRGSALMFLGALTHAGGANTTKAPRDGIIVSYCLGWLRQYENQYLTYPPEVARTFSPDLQRLIGYCMHRPNLGGWQGRDPVTLLEGADPIGPHVDALPPMIAAELKAHYGQAR